MATLLFGGGVFFPASTGCPDAYFLCKRNNIVCFFHDDIYNHRPDLTL